jgi:hypothetical protein
MNAAPLLRFFHRPEDVDAWLDQHKTYLLKTVVPDTKPPSQYPDLTRMWMEANDSSGNRKEFDSRVRDHLEICRERLVDNALVGIYHAEENKVSFVVSNPTDETVEAVRMSASFYAGGALVLASEPHVKPMPPAPKWPDPMDRYRQPMSQFTPGFTAPPFRFLPVRIHRRGDIVQIDYEIGDLGPYQKMSTLPVTIIPNIEELDELEIHLTAYAKNRRDVTTSSEVLAIEDRGWLLGSVVDAARAGRNRTVHRGSWPGHNSSSTSANSAGS